MAHTPLTEKLSASIQRKWVGRACFSRSDKIVKIVSVAPIILRNHDTFVGDLPEGCLRGAIDYAACGGFGAFDFAAGLSSNGIVAASPGALGIPNGSITMTDVLDSLANTLLVGEAVYNLNLFNLSEPES